MKTIELTRDEVKLLVSFLATGDASLTRYLAMARNEAESDLFKQISSDKRMIQGLLEKLIRNAKA